MDQPRIADTIARKLETMILEGVLKPGEKLPPERQLAESLGVSRPSLREAIQKLAARNLLRTRRGGGTFVDEPCVIDGNLISGRTFHDHGHYIGPWIRLLEQAAL